MVRVVLYSVRYTFFRACKMADKRRISLTLQQRIDVLEDLKTYTVSVVAARYHVHPRTIRRIRDKAATIMQFKEKYELRKKHRRMRRPRYEVLELQLMQWYDEMKAVVNHVSDAMLLEKAAELRQGIPSCSTFKVSQGWLAKFKRRHKIRLANTSDERVSADQDAADKFVEEFKRLIEEEGVRLENIYNVDESRLLWKAIPKRTLAEQNENNISDIKTRKDKITIGLCTNVTGSHKIKPLVIHRYKSPRAIKHCRNSLPVILKAQNNASMDQSIFLDWYENNFKTSVRQYQLGQGISGRVILLLGDTKEHRFKIEDDNNFKVLYLPADTISLIQPMDQGIIQKLKKGFRHKLLQNVLTYDNGVSEFYKNYNIKDCLQLIQAAWTEVSALTVRNAWKKILPDLLPIRYSEETNETSLPEIQDLIREITGEECDSLRALHFLSACEEAERISPIEQEEECRQQIKEEPEEMIVERNNDDDDDDDDDNDDDDGDDDDDEDDDDEEEKKGDDNRHREGQGGELIEDFNHVFQQLEALTTNMSRPLQLLVEAVKALVLQELSDNTK